MRLQGQASDQVRYNFCRDKKTQAVSVDQTVLLGCVNGYMGAYKGNAFAPISPPNFPITEKAI